MLDADDVVLAKLAAGLDFDHFQQNLSRIFEPLNRSPRGNAI
jgi:hypothetical protein